MNETNLSWDDLRLFLAVARNGGLAGAAPETEKSAPTLGRRILSLERLLGADLFERSVRGYTLTTAGTELFEQVLQLEREVQPIISLARRQPARRVKVSAGTWVSHYLCNQLAMIDDKLNLQFISTDLVLDITHREAVIGIRNAEPTHPSLVRQPLQRVKFAVYAKNNSISTWAQVTGSTPSAHWVRRQTDIDNFIEISDPRNALDLAIAGVVRAVLPVFIGDTQPNLVRVTAPIEELEHQQWLVTHQDDRNQPEVRRVVNWLKSTLGNDITLR